MSLCPLGSSMQRLLGSLPEAGLLQSLSLQRVFVLEQVLIDEIRPMVLKWCL